MLLESRRESCRFESELKIQKKNTWEEKLIRKKKKKKKSHFIQRIFFFLNLPAEIYPQKHPHDEV